MTIQYKYKGIVHVIGCICINGTPVIITISKDKAGRFTKHTPDCPCINDVGNGTLYAAVYLYAYTLYAAVCP